MTVITIPLTTLPVGSTDTPSSAIPNGAAFATITIDRTVNGGLNSLTSATMLTLTVYESLDGGTTWIQAASATCPGGIFTKHGGVQVDINDVGVMIYPGATHAKGNITITGPSSVAISGNLTIQ